MILSTGPVACALLTLALLLASPMSACDLGTGSPFKPERRKFVAHTKRDLPERLPAPSVTVKRIIRGSAVPGSSCEDAGLLDLTLSLPDSSGYSLSEVGFYFRVVSGDEPDLIFPSIPIAGPVVERTMEISFPWLDGHPRSQKPLDLRVEVFAVAHDLSIGPQTEFSVQAPVGVSSNP